jgi:hypothetical protein
MIILKDISQINDKLNSIFRLEEQFSGIEFVQDILPESVLKEKVENTGIILGKESTLEELSLLIFQLKDYVPALCNFSNMLLLSKNYLAVYHFTTKLFISHIGNIHYQSQGEFNYKQRFFDRFIEIIKTCKISKEVYIPFIFEIFKADPSNVLYTWRAPSLEYMKDFYTQNTEWVEEFLQSHSRKFEMINLLCEFNTQKGLAVAVEEFEKNSYQSDKLLNLFKQNKTQLLLYIDKNIGSADSKMLSKYTQILLSLDNDTDAKSRLEEIYKITYDVVLRNLISEKIGLVETSSFKNEKQFLFAVRRELKPEDIQERTLGLVFNKMNLKYSSGLSVDNAGYTFLVNIFKSDANLLNLKKYLSLKGVFEQESLSEFVGELFSVVFFQEDINASKWAIRLIVLFADEKLENELYYITKTLFLENRVKEAKYLTLCLNAAYKPSFFEFLKESIENNLNNFIKDKAFYLKTYANYNNISYDKILDNTASQELTEENIKEQTARLFHAFIANRTFTKDEFENIFINHKLFNKLAQGLVFGEYRFGGLNNSFILKQDKKVYVVGKELSGDDFVIGIVHPQDCDTRFQAAYNAIEQPLFNQFDEVLYNVKDFSRSSVFVNVFAGMMIKPYDFFQKLSQVGFEINKESTSLTFNSFIHINKTLSLVAEIELEKPIQLSNPYITVANLYFYQLNDVLFSNGKFITNKQNAIGVGSISNRYFGFILTSIINAVKVAK